MKLVNILGAVIAAHVAVLVLAVAIPGCRTTRTSAPAAGPEEGAAVYTPTPARAASPAFSAAPELADRDLNPPLAGAEPALFDPDAPALAPGGSGRFSPTRPGATPSTAVNSPAPAAAVATTPATTYTVQRGDNLWSLAKRHGITVRELTRANNISADAVLRLGQVLVIPGQAAAPVAPIGADAAAAEASAQTYTIQSGDTLGRIARRHGITVAQLKAFNSLTSDLVRAGDTLAIPESAAGTGSEPAAATASGPATPTAAAAGGAYRHVVAPGESLTVIAQRYGVKVGEVALANNIGDPSFIRPGQELVIPGLKATDRPASVPTVGAARAVASPLSPGAPSVVPAANDDLDAGLDTSAENVPVIDVERSANRAEAGDEVPTITIGGGGGSAEEPPMFR